MAKLQSDYLYERTSLLIPQDATDEEIQEVVEYAKPNRRSIMWSVNDAFIDHPGLTRRTVEVWDVQRIAGSQEELETWVETYYPPLPDDIIYHEFSPIEPPVNDAHIPFVMHWIRGIDNLELFASAVEDRDIAVLRFSSNLTNEFVQRAAELGKNVIGDVYSNDSSIVTRLRDEPNIIGWMLPDESSDYASMRAIYDMITATDPESRPVYFNLGNYDTNAIQQGADVCDILGNTCYPTWFGRGDGSSRAQAYWSAYRTAEYPPTFAIVQGFAGDQYDHPEYGVPIGMQLRADMYAALIGGADELWPYGTYGYDDPTSQPWYDDIIAAINQTYDELNGLDGCAYLFHAEEVSTVDINIISGPTTAPMVWGYPAEPSIVFTERVIDGVHHIISVNLTDEHIVARFDTVQQEYEAFDVKTFTL